MHKWRYVQFSQVAYGSFVIPFKTNGNLFFNKKQAININDGNFVSNKQIRERKRKGLKEEEEDGDEEGNSCSDDFVPDVLANGERRAICCWLLRWLHHWLCSKRPLVPSRNPSSLFISQVSLPFLVHHTQLNLYDLVSIIFISN